MRSLVSPACLTRLRASRRPLSVGSVSSVRNLSSDFFFGIPERLGRAMDAAVTGVNTQILHHYVVRSLSFNILVC